ncbi:MAG: cysteate synthase [Candidatus Bipolaricaulota bacterium]
MRSRWVSRCTSCGRALPPLALSCPQCPRALPRSDYAERRFVVGDREDLFRFSSWLPCASTVKTEVGPRVVKGRRLAAALGLDALWIAFNGYAPEWGALNPTGTFKDFEALPTLLHLREHGKEEIVLASAGNTARAFAHAATVLDMAAVLVVPEALTPLVWSPLPVSDSVRLVSVRDADYAGSIALAGAIADRWGLASEGGARNVARRDGMATAMLEYARITGELPRHYVQAIGSGTGAIAAWEACLRLQGGGGFSGPLPRLHLAQNAPFAPIHEAWDQGQEISVPGDEREVLRTIDELAAPVLANRNPPYALVGGVRDALLETRGRTYAVDNAAIAEAQVLFEASEGVPVGPEGGAALAALRDAVGRGWIPRGDSVLLHVTGNGDAVLRRASRLWPVPIWRTVSLSQGIPAALASL